MSKDAQIMAMALAECKPEHKKAKLTGYPGVKFVYRLWQNVIYQNTAAAPGAKRLVVIK